MCADLAKNAHAIVTLFQEDGQKRKMVINIEFTRSLRLQYVLPQVKNTVFTF